LTVETGIDLLKILRLSLSGSTFEYVQNCKTYDDAIAKLNEGYVKLKNVIFARYELISRKQLDDPGIEMTDTSAVIKQECYFCGHFAKVCRSASERTAFVSVTSLVGSSSSSTATELKNAIVEPKINGTNITALIDTGSSLSFIDERLLTNDNHKKRMVNDYSQTINLFTLLHAYPLGKINDMVQAISKYHFFSTVDLKSAYYQIPISARDRPYTAFEAGGRLYQFKRISFGVTNGVTCFQRVMDNILPVEKLKDTFVYVDNVMICGMNQEEHDENLNRFREVAEKYNLRLNNDKYHCNSSTSGNTASFRRVLGMFPAYSQWIPRFSEKIHALARCTKYPLPQPAVDAFKALTKDIVNSVVTAIDDELPFTVETDASDHAIATTLSQLGKPVSFFSRMLSNSEQRHSSVEKEAYGIVEAIRKWRHYLLGHHFHLITDQRSVALVFNNKQAGKLKSDKITPYPESVVASRTTVVENVTLQTIHNNMCHPGVTRMAHYARSKNLPYTMEEIQRMTNSCRVCAELKPRFFKGDSGKLIKATAPFERRRVFPIPVCISLPRHLYPNSQQMLNPALLPVCVLTSRTTAHNPQGNGQAESTKIHNLRTGQWEEVIGLALHSIRTLLSTATNATPHERLFGYPRRTPTGTSLPPWLTTPGIVLMRRLNRTNKHDPLVEEVELLEANPKYAHVRLTDGRRTTVSLRHLAPAGGKFVAEDGSQDEAKKIKKLKNRTLTMLH
ncbi:Retrovirus-related Pol polyprotein from transposon 17.6, partial [Trichinella nelsoni]